jgi:hypothetical protein
MSDNGTRFPRFHTAARPNRPNRPNETRTSLADATHSGPWPGYGMFGHHLPYQLRSELGFVYLGTVRRSNLYIGFNSWEGKWLAVSVFLLRTSTYILQ